MPDALTEYLGFPEEMTGCLDKAYARRLVADYAPRHVTAEEAQQVITWAEQFLNRVEEDIT